MQLFRGLLISCTRNYEHRASAEISHILREYLDYQLDDLHIRHTGVEGLVTVGFHDDQNYHGIVKQLMSLDPGIFKECRKIRPIDHVLESLDDVTDVVKLVEPSEGSTYRVTVEKRLSALSSSEIITAIAPILDEGYDVDLENPDFVVLVEVLENVIGLSIVNPDLIYSTPIAFDEF